MIFLNLFLTLVLLQTTPGSSAVFFSTNTRQERHKPSQSNDVLCLNAATKFDNLGLLHNVDVQKDIFYTHGLPMESPTDLKWLKKERLAWEAATLRASLLGDDNTTEYVKTLNENFELFLDTREIIDREDVTSVLTIAVKRKRFELLLGGKSNGNSFALEKVVKKANEGRILDTKGEKFVGLYIDDRAKSTQPLQAYVSDRFKDLAKE